MPAARDYVVGTNGGGAKKWTWRGLHGCSVAWTEPTSQERPGGRRLPGRGRSQPRRRLLGGRRFLNLGRPSEGDSADPPMSQDRRPPHAATLPVTRTAQAAMKTALPPHPATVSRIRLVQPATKPSRPPHPATLGSTGHTAQARFEDMPRCGHAGSCGAHVAQAAALAVPRDDPAQQKLYRLKKLSELLFAIGKAVNSNIQEVQAMYHETAGGTDLRIGVNSVADKGYITAGLTTFAAERKAYLAAEKEARQYNTAKWKEVVELHTLEALRTYSAGYDITSKLLSDGEITMHAEQNLLQWAAKKLKAGNDPAVSAIYVIGTKPPCSNCRPVLRAFGVALEAIYHARLHFNDSAGLATEVPKLALASTNGQTPTYDSFVARYAVELG